MADWLDHAGEAAVTLKTNQKYSEIGPSWSKIKPVFMALQHNKCAYCERKLPPAEFGRVETDVEHFRPKNRVQTWPPASRPDLDYAYSLGDADDNGYYWLAYEPLNYLTACKTCNSNRKRDYFPISKARGPVHATARELLEQEKPYLIYPLTTMDDDPEDVIGFNGIVPYVKANRGHRRARGRVIIDFFELAIRDDLVRERFLILDNLLNNLKILENGNAQERERAQRRVDERIADDAEHANCARSFVRLFRRDARRAYDLYEAAEDIVTGLDR